MFEETKQTFPVTAQYYDKNFVELHEFILEKLHFVLTPKTFFSAPAYGHKHFFNPKSADLDHKRFVESNYDKCCYFYLSRLKSLFESKLKYTFTLEIDDYYYANDTESEKIDFEGEYIRCLRITATSEARKKPQIIEIY